MNRPKLIPADTEAYRAAESVRPGDVWLFWREQTGESQDAMRVLTQRILSSSLARRALTAFNVSEESAIDIGERITVNVSHAVASLSTQLYSNVVAILVEQLGIPRSRAEALLREQEVD